MAREVHKFVNTTPKVGDKGISISFNFSGTIKQIIVEPSTPATYDFGIVDETDMLNYVRYKQEGPITDQGLDLIIFPGEKQIIIDEVSAPTEFKIKLIYQK